MKTTSIFSAIYEFFVPTPPEEKPRTGFMPHSPSKPEVSTSPIAIISTTSSKDSNDDCPSLSSSLSSSCSSDDLTILSDMFEDYKSSLDTTMVLEEEPSVYDECEWMEEKKLPTPETIPRPGREIRSNSAHLRMIAAELNMMRNNKIICPLRQRYHLPRRSDSFIIKSSPLAA
ncbi:hypothetical protein BJV82DRAFT_638167 [Fennellomyces sp. T-0311]|nr:hypothetical protein BJV82DRAFT_638167 [Fennellomyces sp. T-0311]